MTNFYHTSRSTNRPSVTREDNTPNLRRAHGRGVGEVGQRSSRLLQMSGPGIVTFFRGTPHLAYPRW